MKERFYDENGREVIFEDGRSVHGLFSGLLFLFTVAVLGLWGLSLITGIRIPDAPEAPEGRVCAFGSYDTLCLADAPKEELKKGGKPHFSVPKLKDFGKHNSL